jgi:hypothetical protein
MLTVPEGTVRLWSGGWGRDPGYENSPSIARPTTEAATNEETQMNASSRNTFQVHANVNSDRGDSALRVTITTYDENGYQVEHQTWRRHVRTLSMDGLDWQAYSAVTELCKMMGELAAGQTLSHEEVDVPLF